MAFLESFWLATSAAAPVIALAAVVTLPESVISVRTVSALRFLAETKRLSDRLKRLTEASGDTSALSIADTLKRLTTESGDTSASSLGELYETLIEPPWEKLHALARLTQRLSFGNVIIQAWLLAVSLAALAYRRDVVPPWVGIIVAVGGILLLAWTSVMGTSIRIQWGKGEPSQSTDLPPEGEERRS